MVVGKPTLILSILLALLVALAGYCGVFVSSTYDREVPVYAAQGIGQDVVNLALVVPLLLVSILLAYRGSRRALLIWSGTVLYLAYNYVIYAVGVHFNTLFLVYCAILGLSFYLLAFHLLNKVTKPIHNWFGAKTPTKSVGVFLVLVGILFYYVWLSEIIPALLSSSTPTSITDIGLFTNPVHVLDIAICLPAMILSGIILIQKKSMGFLLAPMMLVFGILMAAAIVGMIIAMYLLEQISDLSSIGIFAIIVLIGVLFTVLFLRSLKKKEIEAD